MVLAFTAVAVVLYRNLTPERIERRPWVRKLVQGTGWKSVTRAIGVYAGDHASAEWQRTEKFKIFSGSFVFLLIAVGAAEGGA